MWGWWIPSRPRGPRELVCQSPWTTRSVTIPLGDGVGPSATPDMEFLDHKAPCPARNPRVFGAPRDQKAWRKCQTLFGLCRDPKSLYPFDTSSSRLFNLFFPHPFILLLRSRRFLSLVLAWDKTCFSELESKNIRLQHPRKVNYGSRYTLLCTGTHCCVLGGVEFGLGSRDWKCPLQCIGVFFVFLHHVVFCTICWCLFLSLTAIYPIH